MWIAEAQHQDPASQQKTRKVYLSCCSPGQRKNSSIRYASRNKGKNIWVTWWGLTSRHNEEAQWGCDASHGMRRRAPGDRKPYRGIFREGKRRSQCGLGGITTGRVELGIQGVRSLINQCWPGPAPDEANAACLSPASASNASRAGGPRPACAEGRAPASAPPARPGLRVRGQGLSKIKKSFPEGKICMGTKSKMANE